MLRGGKSGGLNSVCSVCGYDCSTDVSANMYCKCGRTCLCSTCNSEGAGKVPNCRFCGGAVTAERKAKRGGAAGSKRGVGGAKMGQSALTKEELEERKALSALRVVQPNLVYVTNIPLNFLKESRENLSHLLKRNEYFGQYGKIVKLIVNTNTVYNASSPLGPTVACYITFAVADDAQNCIDCVNGAWLEGKLLRASHGTTKYCAYFLRGETCPNADCLYLHELGVKKDSFTKEAMAAGKNLFTENVYPRISFAKATGKNVLPPATMNPPMSEIVESLVISVAYEKASSLVPPETARELNGDSFENCFYADSEEAETVFLTPTEEAKAFKDWPKPTDFFAISCESPPPEQPVVQPSLLSMVSSAKDHDSSTDSGEDEIFNHIVSGVVETHNTLEPFSFFPSHGIPPASLSPSPFWEPIPPMPIVGTLTREISGDNGSVFSTEPQFVADTPLESTEEPVPDEPKQESKKKRKQKKKNTEAVSVESTPSPKDPSPTIESAVEEHKPEPVPEPAVSQEQETEADPEAMDEEDIDEGLLPSGVVMSHKEKRQYLRKLKEEKKNVTDESAVSKTASSSSKKKAKLEKKKRAEREKKAQEKERKEREKKERREREKQIMEAERLEQLEKAKREAEEREREKARRAQEEAERIAREEEMKSIEAEKAKEMEASKEVEVEVKPEPEPELVPEAPTETMKEENALKVEEQVQPEPEPEPEVKPEPVEEPEPEKEEEEEVVKEPPPCHKNGKCTFSMECEAAFMQSDNGLYFAKHCLCCGSESYNVVQVRKTLADRVMDAVSANPFFANSSIAPIEAMQLCQEYWCIQLCSKSNKEIQSMTMTQKSYEKTFTEIVRNYNKRQFKKQKASKMPANRMAFIIEKLKEIEEKIYSSGEGFGVVTYFDLCNKYSALQKEQSEDDMLEDDEEDDEEDMDEVQNIPDYREFDLGTSGSLQFDIEDEADIALELMDLKRELLMLDSGDQTSYNDFVKRTWANHANDADQFIRPYLRIPMVCTDCGGVLFVCQRKFFPRRESGLEDEGWRFPEVPQMPICVHQRHDYSSFYSVHATDVPKLASFDELPEKQDMGYAEFTKQMEVLKSENAWEPGRCPDLCYRGEPHEALEISSANVFLCPLNFKEEFMGEFDCRSLDELCTACGIYLSPSRFVRPANFGGLQEMYRGSFDKLLPKPMPTTSPLRPKLSENTGSEQSLFPLPFDMLLKRLAENDEENVTRIERNFNSLLAHYNKAKQDLIDAQKKYREECARSKELGLFDMDNIIVPDSWFYKDTEKALKGEFEAVAEYEPFVIKDQFV